MKQMDDQSEGLARPAGYIGVGYYTPRWRV